jgi:hypothetical protein
VALKSVEGKPSPAQGNLTVHLVGQKFLDLLVMGVECAMDSFYRKNGTPGLVWKVS